MVSFHTENAQIILNKKGSRDYIKGSYPVRYGNYSEVKTRDFIFQFNMNGEIKYLQGRGDDWPHPAEWLKRTAANDWVYYSTGGYSKAFDYFGEHYIPCLPYSSNSILLSNPFNDRAVKSTIDTWSGEICRICDDMNGNVPYDLKEFIVQLNENQEDMLTEKAQRLHDIIGGQPSVLPPDTRHVDYNVIPIVIADGCLYHCSFCRVKSRHDFKCRTKDDILLQIENLKELYSDDLFNYNSIYLGQHDALNAGQDLIEYTATSAYESFGFKTSTMKGAYMFLFGSVDSLLGSETSLWECLCRLPFFTFINIGLESFDPDTLNTLGKPVTLKDVDEAFSRIIDLNRKYGCLEITANFVYGDNLPENHMRSCIELMNNRLERFSSRGTVYFSPLVSSVVKAENYEKNRGMIRKFNEVKKTSRLPAYIYLIQRL